MDADSLRDPVALAQALIRRPSVTPADAGAMDLVQGWLEALGFTCRRMPFGDVENLYARRGAASPNLCFAGHVDVVPPGDAAAWSADPFAGEVRPGEAGEVLIGRGAVDMKGAVAAWIAAVARAGDVPGSQSLLITGDEEGVAVNGTRRVVEALRAEGERLDACVVGEPTNVTALGDMVKIGRRGSFHAWVVVEGVQGHAAYPHRAANPVPVLIDALHRMTTAVLDEGAPGFQPSNLQVTELEVGNPAANVIPPRARGRLNVRFNPHWTGERLTRWMEEICAEAGRGFAGSVRVEARTSGEAFVTPPGAFSALVAEAVREATGREPELSTSGGTSDARFMRTLCPVVEFGLVGRTMHQVDEQTPVADLRTLADVYEGVIRRFAAS